MSKSYPVKKCDKCNFPLKLTKPQLKQLVRLHDANLSFVEIAKIIGMDRSDVFKVWASIKDDSKVMRELRKLNEVDRSK